MNSGGFKPVSDYFRNYVFTIQKGGDRNYDENEIRQEIVRIASRYGIYQCIEAANAIQKFLETRGVSGKRIKIDTGFRDDVGGMIIYTSTEQLIATNGIHIGILIKINGEPTIFDNIHHAGLPAAEWFSNISVNVRPNVTDEDF